MAPTSPHRARYPGSGRHIGNSSANRSIRARRTRPRAQHCIWNRRCPPIQPRTRPLQCFGEPFGRPLRPRTGADGRPGACGDVAAACRGAGPEPKSARALAPGDHEPVACAVHEEFGGRRGLPMSSRYLPGLSDERRAVLEFCGELTEEQWAAPSAAAGWSVAEVVIHMTTGVRALLTPSAAAIVATRDLERLNEQLVDEKRSHTTRHVLPEFDTWSRRGVRALSLFTAAGIRRIQLPIGELGWYRLDLIPAMLLFDWHTHLRHDIAAALDLPPPPTDALRMNAILTWLTVLLERSHREALSWLDAPVALTFTGPGGGTWRIEPRGGRLRVRPGQAAGAAAHIAALALEFPQWGTRRLPWRAGAVAITGDAELGARVLDSINLV
ncbi:hypothetical protein C8259_08430 [Nocardia nova]|uniref:Mycothiol-dependent maleylpyruvate isomerase metal-binding domain-containing protein n=2 Tax=Nocardia TaxID=1817 RepID=A0A2T2Z834_9NOCA|nr:hypothetical protein C8259_08430 [Nocardia nova]